MTTNACPRPSLHLTPRTEWRYHEVYLVAKNCLGVFTPDTGFFGSLLVHSAASGNGQYLLLCCRALGNCVRDAGVELERHFRTTLCDKEPSVMAATLNALMSMAAANPAPFR